MERKNPVFAFLKLPISLFGIFTSKKVYITIFFALFLYFAADAANRFSVATGNWNATSTWSATSGGASGASVPGAGDVVTIEGGFTVTVDVNTLALTSLTISSGSTLSVTNAFTVSSTTINLNGTYTNGSTGAITCTTLVVGATGIYNHNSTAAAFLTGATTTTWDAASNFNINGFVGNNQTTNFAGKSYGNITYNCTGQTGTLNLVPANSTTTIKGNFNIQSTGSGRLHFRLTGVAFSPTITVLGNFSISGTSYLDMNNAGGGSNAVILNLGGNFNQSGGTINETTTTGGQTATINFNKAGIQTFTKTGGTISSAAPAGTYNIIFNVNSGSTLDMGTSVLDGARAKFTLSAGGGIITAHAEGISTSNNTGCVQVTGTITYNNGSNIEYNGAVAQVTGNGLPVTVNNLTFSNNGIKTLLSNVTVSNNLSINGSAKLYTDTYQITGNGTGTFTMASGTELQLGNTGSGTNVLFPTNFTRAHTTLNSTSTVTYQSNAAQTVSSEPQYGSLVIATGGVKTLTGTQAAALVQGAMSVNAGTFDLGNTTATSLTVGGTTSVPGILTFGTTSKTVTINGNLSGAGTINMNGAGLAHSLILNGVNNAISIFNTSAGSGSTVNYSLSGDQQVFSSVNYQNLTISGSGTKTLAFDITVNNNMSILGSATLATGPRTITGNASGTLTMNAGTSLTLGSTATTNAVPLPAFLVYTLNSNSTVVYQANVGQVISNTPTYGNLTLTTGATSTSKTATGNLTVNGNLAVNNGAGTVTLSFGATPSSIKTIAGNITGDGTIDMSTAVTHVLNLAGNYSNTGSFISGTGTVNYNGTVQNVGGLNYNNLTISGGGIKTLLGDASVGATLNLSNGKIVLGTNSLTISSATAVSGANSSNYIVADGTGQLKKVIALGGPFAAYVLPVGDATNYSPVSLTFTANTLARTIGVRVTNAVHPNDGGTADHIARYWTFTDGTAGSYTYDATFTYVPADFTGVYANLRVSRWNSTTWSQYPPSGVSPTITLLGGNATTATLHNNDFTGHTGLPITFTWNQAAAADWNTASNWSPSRSVVQNNDVLVFDGSITATPTAINVPTQTIGKLLLLNNANVNLQSAAAGQTITILGGTGTDLDIPLGSTLQLSSTGANQIGIAFNPATQDASIAGSLIINANAAFSNSYIVTNSNTIVTGTITNNGGSITSTTGNLSFNGTSTYNHARDGGALPLATWATTSTCSVTGLAGANMSSISADPGFGNFIFDCPGLTFSPRLTGNVALTFTVKGNMDILRTNGRSLDFTNNDADKTLQVNGNLTIGNGVGVSLFTIKSAGLNNTVVYLGGNLSVLANATLRSTSANVTTFNFGFTGATSATSVTWGGAGTYTNGSINYVIQNIPAGKTVNLNGFAANTVTIANGQSLTINPSATLNCGTQVVASAGTGAFILQAGGILGIGQANRD